MRQPTSLHKRPLLFNKKQIKQIDKILQQLVANLAAPLIMLTDISGQVITYQGHLSEDQSDGLAALAAGSFAAASEIGNFLGLNKGFQHQLLEGKLASIYVLAVGTELLLIIAFTDKTTLGLVRIYTEPAKKKLMKLVVMAAKNRTQNQGKSSSLTDKLKADIENRLDELVH